MASMVDAEGAVRDYLITNQDSITGEVGGDNITVDLHQFNEDSPILAFMVRDAGGIGGHVDLQLDQPTVQVWVRDNDAAEAKVLIARIDDLLHQLGPRALNASVFCLAMFRNVGRQRLDDLESGLVQYFITYNMSCVRID